MSPHRTLDRLGYALTEPLPPRGSYVPARLAGGLLWVSGHTGRDRDGARLTGAVGLDVTDEEARAEARRTALGVASLPGGATVELEAVFAPHG